MSTATAHSHNGSELRKLEVEREFTALSFHYGLSFSEIAAMPRWARRLYWRALPKHLASQQLAAIEASAFPNMEKRAQERALAQLQKLAGVHRKVEPIKPKTMNQMEQAGAELGIAVTTE